MGSTSALWSNLDEAAPGSDADYNWSTNNTAATLEVALAAVTDPLLSTGHVVSYRLAQTYNGTPDGGGNAVTVTVSLVQGTTVIASNGPLALTGSWAAGSFTLSGAQADAITDYADLRLRIVTSSSGGATTNRRGAGVSFAELAVPDLAAPSYTASATLDGTGDLAAAAALAYTAGATLAGTGTLDPTATLVGAIAYTSAGSGNWSTPGTWTPNGVPGAGDTVTITSGHTVTVDVPVTIGTGTGAAILMGSGTSGVTTLEVDAALVVKGHIQGNALGNYCDIVVAAGAGIEMDGDVGVQPLLLGGQGMGILRVTFNGTTSSHCYLRTAPAKAAESAGAYNARTCFYVSGVEDWASYQWTYLLFQGQYVDITDIGTSSHFGCRMSAGWSATTRPVLEHVTGLRSNLAFYGAQADNAGPNGGLILRDATFTQTPGAVDIITGYPGVGISVNGSGYGGVTQAVELDTVGCDQPISIYYPKSVTNVVFGTGVLSSAEAYANEFGSTWSDNLVIVPPDFPLIWPIGTYSRSYLLNTDTADNPHISGLAFTGTGTLNQTDFLWDAPLCTGGVDDTINAFYTRVGCTVNLQGGITLPIMVNATATPIDLGWFGSDDATGGEVHITHCTLAAHTDRPAVICDNIEHSGRAGLLAEIKSNIFWAPAAYPGTVFVDDSVGGPGTGIVTDAALPANITNNDLFHTIYRGVYSSGSPGADDVAVDPGFVDPTRNLITYWRSQVGVLDPAYVAGQTPNVDLPKAIAWMVAHPADVPTLLDWVRAGFAPTNAALAGTAHDATDIGAVAVVAAGGETLTASATLAGIGDLAATATLGYTASATLAGTGDLAAAVSVAGAMLTASATLTGTGDLAAAVSVAGAMLTASATLTGTGDLAAAVSVAGAMLTASATLTGTGDLAAAVSVAGAMLTASATLTGTGGLAATAALGYTAGATLAGAGTLTAHVVLVGAAADLFDAVQAALTADSGLTTAFGRPAATAADAPSTGWLYHAAASPRDPLPRAVWADVDRADDVLLAEAGERTAVAGGHYQITTYAASRAQARRLARQIARAIEAASDAGAIVCDEMGTVATARATVPLALDQVDPEKGPHGEDVRSHLLQFHWLGTDVS